MDFSTELERTPTIRVYSANDPLTGTEAATAMDSIIAKNIFFTSGGDLTSAIDELREAIITLPRETACPQVPPLQLTYHNNGKAPPTEYAKTMDGVKSGDFKMANKV